MKKRKKNIWNWTSILSILYVSSSSNASKIKKKTLESLSLLFVYITCTFYMFLEIFPNRWLHSECIKLYVYTQQRSLIAKIVTTLYEILVQEELLQKKKKQGKTYQFAYLNQKMYLLFQLSLYQWCHLLFVHMNHVYHDIWKIKMMKTIHTQW